jgi:hypothetical protein
MHTLLLVVVKPRLLALVSRAGIYSRDDHQKDQSGYN